VAGVSGSGDVARWLKISGKTLRAPASQAYYLAVTDSRQEFARWTGRRLNSFALGCYCYLPLTSSLASSEAQIDYDGSHTATRAASFSLREPVHLYSPSLWDDPETPPDRLITPTGLAANFRHL